MYIVTEIECTYTIVRVDWSSCDLTSDPTNARRGNKRRDNDTKNEISIKLFLCIKVNSFCKNGELNEISVKYRR